MTLFALFYFFFLNRRSNIYQLIFTFEGIFECVQVAGPPKIFTDNKRSHLFLWNHRISWNRMLLSGFLIKINSLFCGQLWCSLGQYSDQYSHKLKCVLSLEARQRRSIPLPHESKLLLSIWERGDEEREGDWISRSIAIKKKNLFYN